MSPITAATRWLTETRQYLVACTAVVAAVGALYLAVAKAGLPIEAFYAAPVPFLLVFCFTTLPRWFSERRKRWLVGRIRPSANTGQSEAYFQIGPYGRSQHERYSRADNAHRQILEWFLGSNEPILIMTGQSGTGKSSLIEVYLIPELEVCKPPLFVVKIRTLGRPETQLREAMLRQGLVWDSPSALIRGLGTPELLKRAAGFRQFNRSHTCCAR